jgi:hypothetical protein
MLLFRPNSINLPKPKSFIRFVLTFFDYNVHKKVTFLAAFERAEKVALTLLQQYQYQYYKSFFNKICQTCKKPY